MALTFEEFENLRNRGFSTDQIIEMQKGDQRGNLDQTLQTIKTGLGVGKFVASRGLAIEPEIATPQERLGVAQEIPKTLFGTAGPTVASLVGTGVESTARLLGKDIGTEATQELERRLGEPKAATKNIAFTFIELYPGGGTLTSVLRALPGGAKIGVAFSKTLRFIPESLRASAIKDYLRVLAPTKEETKFIAQRVAPGLAERKVIALTRKGLQQKAEAGAEAAGQIIEETVERLPAQKISLKPIIDALEKSKQRFVVPGTEVVAEPAKLAATNQIIATVKELGDDVSPKSLIALRRIWDETVAQAKGFIGKTLKEGSEIEIKRAATSAIREEIGKTFPDLAKINAEYSFWKNVDNTISATIRRETGRGPSLTQRLATGVGAISGFKTSGIAGAALGATLTKAALKAFSSPAWKTTSAVLKNQIADALVGNNVKKAVFILSKIAAATNQK